MDLVKEALKEEIKRWQNWHTSHLRELQEFEINLERDYKNVELTMRYYGETLVDELQIKNQYPISTHIDLKNYDEIGKVNMENISNSVSIGKNWSHKEE